MPITHMSYIFKRHNNAVLIRMRRIPLHAQTYIIAHWHGTINYFERHNNAVS